MFKHTPTGFSRLIYSWLDFISLDTCAAQKNINSIPSRQNLKPKTKNSWIYKRYNSSFKIYNLSLLKLVQRSVLKDILGYVRVFFLLIYIGISRLWVRLEIKSYWTRVDADQTVTMNKKRMQNKNKSKSESHCKQILNQCLGFAVFLLANAIFVVIY